MEETFITSIKINKVRHLEGLEIRLSDTERKHLILTGKNGSGKTSVLLEIRNYISALTNNWLQNKDSNFWSIYQQYLNQINSIKNNSWNYLKNSDQNNGINNYWHDNTGLVIQQRHLKILENEWSFLQKIASSNFDISIEISNSNIVYQNFIQGNFLSVFFDSKRINFIGSNNAITKQVIRDNYGIRELANLNFGQYIVNLKAKKSFAKDENNSILVAQIDSWFERFTNLLKQVFDDNSIELKFDSDSFNFYINSENKPSFDFNTLSDGYSALFAIITEIMMRMESKSSAVYDLQGIVLIDEIETHLHIDLQKKILPFLTSFFPKIQFIVTTHSPFVLSSVDNAVIYDLEKQIRVEDLSGYSYSNIIKSYFGADEYSAELREKVSEYETLLNLNNLNLPQKERLYELKLFFKELPKSLSPELQLKISQLELAELAA